MAIEYNKIDVGEGNYKISPSQLTTFYRNPKEWLDILNGNNPFKGNDSTLMGTCIHYIFETQFKDITEDEYWKDVREYLNKEVLYETINEFQMNHILKTISDVYPTIVNWINNSDECNTIHSEVEVKYKLPKSITGETKHDYYIAGSIDAIIEDNTAKSESPFGIRDYKTSKRKVSNIDNYLHQLVTYAVAWNATHPKDQQVGFVEVVNIPITKKGIDFNIIRKYITKELIDNIETILKEIVLTHKTIVKYPELTNIVFREGVDFMGRLKPLEGEEM